MNSHVRLRSSSAFLLIAASASALSLSSCQPIAPSGAPATREVAAPPQGLALAGFEDVAAITGLVQPTVVKFAPNGKVFVGQKDGRIYVYDSVDDTTATLFADLRTQVMNFWDRGMLGLAVDPNYPATPHVYVLYTWDVDSLSGTAPRWNDACADATGAGCVAYARLARLTDMGSSAATTSSLAPLLSGWGQQFPSHSIGSLNFGPDGALYLSAGEGANFNAEDWGQWAGNPLGDPPGGAMNPPSARGGALRSQSLRRPGGDPILLSGAILRLDKNTGAHLADNPLAGNANANAKRIIASGLRNPFRFTIHPTTGELWVGDVGWGTYEEINRLSKTAPAENFGWPCWEGNPRQGGYDAANLTLCEDLYATALHVTPHYAYHHNNKIVAGESCSTGSSSISGLAVYNGGSYPSDYQGALFFADYTRKCIWVMRATAGVPDASRISNFVTAAANPVDLQIGPNGDLFYVDLDGGTVRRVRYRSPNAVASGNPLSGPVPLLVNFSGAGSTPANSGAALTYAWDLDNDGAFDDGSSLNASFTYNTQGTYTARLRVTETGGGSDISDPITIVAGPPAVPNDAPVPVVDTPVVGTSWIVGTNVSFSGHATDTEDGTIPAAGMSWDIVMQHCPSDCHPHVIQTIAGVTGGNFNAPDHEYPSYIEVKLTVTDSGGKSTTVIRRIDPQTVDLTFNALPSTTPALQLGFSGSSSVTPFTRTVIIGSSHALSASGQSAGSSVYQFASWSDGGAASHSIVAPATAATYTATFNGTAWQSGDIGAVAAVGNWSYSGDTFTVNGSGADIWGTTDEFRYLYRNITGDATITARVASMANTNIWAKSGLMIRDGLAANARNVALFVTPTPANLLRFQRRTTAAATTTDVAGGSGAIPAWVRLVRAGNDFTAFTSTNGTTWTQISTAVNMALPATLPIGLAVTSHADGTLNPTTFDNVTITQPFVAPPLAPTGLGATPGNAVVNLSWTAPSGASSYTIKRATVSGGPYTNVATGVTGTTYSNTGLTNGTTYYYVVSASNSAGESPNSGQAQATPFLNPPGAPTGLTAIAGNTQVSLGWSAASGATSYTVKRATVSGGPYTNVVTGLTGTTYVNTGLTNGTTYYYVVSASNSAGESPNSGQAQATPFLNLPATPTGLTATAGNAQVSLGWGAASGATSYTVKRATVSGGPYTNVVTGLTGTTYVNTGLTNGTPYHFVVSASNSSGESGNSAQASATPTAAPACQSVALNRVSAAASSQETATLTPAMAIDASLTTRWSSLFSDPQWIRIDLGASRRVNRVVLRWEAAASANYTVQVSASTSGPWTTLVSVPNGNGGVDDLAFAGGVGRYVRMNSTARTTVYGNSLFDFAVYGDNNPACQ